MEAAGYGLAHTPIFEDVRVFRRGIGEGSDVVGKEMYEFEDRGGRTLALRPEGTAPMVRAFVQHRPPLPWKAWYVTPAFRYERPQAGRYRQHHQLGVEALGTPDPDLDVEVVSLADGFFRSLGLAAFELRLNSMGDGVCRPGYLELLRAYLAERRTSCAPSTASGSTPTPSGSSTASARSAGRPPPTPRTSSTTCATRAAPTSAGCATGSTPSGCPTRSTTGWSGASTTTPGPPSSSPRRRWSRPRTGSAAGGRYDGLVEMLGGPPTPGIGFGIGIERLLLACDAEGVFPVGPPPLDAFVVDVAGGRVGPGHHRRAPGGPACGPTGPSTAAR